MIDLNAQFLWNNRDRISGNIKRAQKYLDSQVLKDTDKYVPMRTGILAKSGIIGTRIGSGELEYSAPYARKVYYGVNINFSKSRHPLACAKFFEASKAVNKKSWLAEVRKIAGGR
ncbi:MAG: minor capsid protein [Lachnospiraceae bacterium]|nr:minor capsid protein [Ruminococcus sp.]MCM1277090.1 minor capsid protein [Lachnospiraceae bacterium]